MIKSISVAAAVAAAGLASVAAPTASVAEERTITAITGLLQTNVLAQAYLENFVKVVNKVGDGILKIKYVGGQEVVPPTKAAAALKLGQFDMLSCPTAYYIGTVPEGYAFYGANQGPRVLRANGAWELLQKIYAERAGAHLLAWGANMTSYHLYLWKAPKFGKDGLLDLTGYKMRATGTYRPLIRALGGTTINVKSSEVITAVQRGTVDGFGFTDVSLPQEGLDKVTKYRVQPNFYQTNTVETLNLNTWKSLTQAQKDLLNRVAIEFEVTSAQFIETARLREEEIIKKSGIKDVVMKPDIAAKYLEIAHGEAWKELDKRSTYGAQLRPLMYKPGKPNRQLDIGQKLGLTR
jgi:TRAP-type C4-dicarboxylate transport system substrate-binding protein